MPVIAVIIPEEIEVIPTLRTFELPFKVIEAAPIVTMPLILASPRTSRADLDPVVPMPMPEEMYAFPVTCNF